MAKSKKSLPKKGSRNGKKSGPLRLVSLKKSPIKGKKFRANFSDGTHTDFGATGYSDYTKHKDPKRKERYMSRHKKRENWSNMKSAGALSRWILWNKPSLSASIADYKRKLSSRGKK